MCYTRINCCLLDGDGKIDMEELAAMLPIEENLLLKFTHKQKLSTNQFLKIFYKYDTDGNGNLDATELRGFVWDLLHQGFEFPFFLSSVPFSLFAVSRSFHCARE